jgi:lysophospholipase L1-like esterase
MLPNLRVREWLVVCLRWLPPIGLTACLAGFFLVPSFGRFFLYYGSVSSLVILLAWTVTAWIVSITAHQPFVRNLRMVKPKHALIVGIVVGLLLFLRHSIIPCLIPLFFLLMHVSAATERPRLTLAASVLTAMLTLVLVEGLFALPLSMPTLWHVPGLHAIALRRYWSEIDLIQWNPACAQWDPELSYTLRPGTCTFSNPGYTTEYRINSLGVRDDEESLKQPDVVVLGDSHAMGMGVEQDETYASQLERMLNRKVLNTGISSYGTARELRMLQRVDRSRARFLLIQYCSNDFEENREFIDSGGKLPARAREWFDTQVENHRSTRRYYPGKFTDSLLWFVWERSPARLVTDVHAGGRNAEQSDQALKYLFDVIERHPVDLAGMQIVIFQMESFNEGNPSRLKLLLANYPNKSRLRGAQFLDVMTGLGPEHLLLLDGHMNAQGHRRVAERLASVLR